MLSLTYWVSGIGYWLITQYLGVLRSILTINKVSVHFISAGIYIPTTRKE
jgi:hypothetical protein